MTNPMKKLIVLLSIPFLPFSVEAGTRTYQPGYSQELKCYENVYREEYIPGTSANPGRVVSRRERVEVPCRNENTYYTPYEPVREQEIDVDDNSCLEGAILGGILGGGAGYAGSRGDGRGWAIPLGVVVGSVVGCQVDGG